MKHETLATIIAFRRKAPLVGPRIPANGASAQILFFTGVRIERHTDELADSQPVPRGKPSAAPVRPPRQRRRS